MRGRLAEGGPVPGLRGLWGRFWPGPFPLTLDLDAGNGRSGRRRFPGEGLQPLGSIPAPPPQPCPQLLTGVRCQQVIRRPPRPGIVFRSFLFSTVLSGGLQLPKRFIHPSPKNLSFRGVCGQNRFLGSMPKPSDPAETWAKVRVLVWQSAQSCFCLLGGNSCRGGAGSQLGPPRGGLRVSVGIRWPESQVSRVRTLCPAPVSPAFVQEAP